LSKIVYKKVMNHMGEVINFADYLRKAQPNADGKLPVSCMDDRRLKPGRNILGSELYHQIIGGSYNAGINLAVAMEMQKEGSFIRHGRPVHKLAQIAGKVLSRNGYHTAYHARCAAYEGAEAIATSAANPQLNGKRTQHGLVFERSQEINPQLTPDLYFSAVSATDRIVKSGLIVPTAESDRDIKEKVELIDAPHTGSRFLVTDNPDVMFDTAAAYDNGNPAYFNNLGVLADMQREISHVIPVAPELLRAATSVYIGEAATNFLTGENGLILPIQHIDMAQAA
jgi:hypothetical protein